MIETMCRKAERIDKDITQGYYPDIDTLERCEKKVLPLICFFSTDPLKLKDKDYKATVRWCKQYLYKLC